MFKSLGVVAALLVSAVNAVTPVVVQGSDFVNAVSGARFQMIGAAYQPGGSSGYNPGSGVDPLSDAGVCLRDAILMQRLGINTVRIYNLDPNIDHSGCMSIFNAAGIYLILDVNSPLPNESLDRGAPWTTYNDNYMKRVFQIVEAFKNFPNTLGFFAANEVINEASVPAAPQYIRAVTRDIKDYIAKNSRRTIPVGYSAADVRPLLVDTFTYLGCDLANSTSSKMDFFGLNSYSWCGQANYQSSGYDILVSDFSNTTIPIFFSEYGCNQVTPRTFTEVGAIYSAPFSGVFSGGLVYEYSQEPNNYGLVTINSDGSVNLSVDYENLQSQFNKINLQALTAQNSTATGLRPPSCSAVTIRSNITNSFAVPARLPGIQSMIDNGVQGKFPTGTIAVSNTQETATVRASNGQTITGLALKILPNDASNLPGNNTSGTSGTSGPGLNASRTSGGSSPTNSNTAATMQMGAGAVAVGGLIAGLAAFL